MTLRNRSTGFPDVPTFERTYLLLFQEPTLTARGIWFCVLLAEAFAET